jgi:adenylate kinase family enzyme
VTVEGTPVPAYRRVVVLGPTGAGKSTFAIELGRLLDLDVFHLDKLYWEGRPEGTPIDEFARFHEDIVARDSWVIDGNFTGLLDRRLERADTVFLFDFSRLRCLVGVVRRRLSRKRPLPGIPSDRPPYVYPQRVRWLWRFKETELPWMLSKIERHGDRLTVVTLGNRNSVRRFLDDLPAAATER